MIRNSKQSWETGSVVKVGFMSLVVKASIPTPGDFAPDAYILANTAGTQLYKFVPHNGLEKLSPVEARELIADHMHQAQLLADKAIAKVKADHAAIVAINEIIFA